MNYFEEKETKEATKKLIESIAKSVAEEEKPTEEDVKAGCVSAVFGFLIGIVFSFLWTWIALKYWGWFITPFGVKAISYWHTFALILFVNQFIKTDITFLAERSIKDIKEVPTIIFNSIMKEIGKMVIIILAGYLIVTYVM